MKSHTPERLEQWPKILLRAGLIISLVLLSFPSLVGQDKSNNPLSSIPRTLEKKLTERLDLFVEYQRNQDWQRLGPLVSGFAMTLGNKVRLTRKQQEEMLHRIQERPITKFEAKETWGSTANSNRPVSQNTWWIFGCIEYRENGRVVRTQGVLGANLTAGRWVFTNIVVHQTTRFSCADEAPVK